MIKYCVWFSKHPKRTKFFTNRFKAFAYLKKQKIEAYLNSHINTLQEDTIGGINEI